MQRARTAMLTLAVGDVAHVDAAREGQHVVLAHGVDVDVLDHHDLLVAVRCEHGVVQDPRGGRRVAGGHEQQRLGPPLGGLAQALPGGVLPDALEDGVARRGHEREPLGVAVLLPHRVAALGDGRRLRRLALPGGEGAPRRLVADRRHVVVLGGRRGEGRDLLRRGRGDGAGGHAGLGGESARVLAERSPRAKTCGVGLRRTCVPQASLGATSSDLERPSGGSGLRDSERER